MITSSGSRTGLPNSNESERNIQRLVDTSIEVDSSDDVAFVEVLDRFGRGLDVQLFCFLCGKKVPPQRSLASREDKIEISM